jgi:hypothetical protein
MALAAAALTADGQRPDPQILMGTFSPDAGWLEMPESTRRATLLANGARLAAEALASKSSQYWHATASARASENTIGWYIAGTLEQWQGEPLALAVVLEDGGPAAAAEVGQSLLDGLAR